MHFTPTFPRFLIGTLILVLLVACTVTNPTSDAEPIATQFSQPMP